MLLFFFTVNAADNKVRDPTMDTIKIDIDVCVIFIIKEIFCVMAGFCHHQSECCYAVCWGLSYSKIYILLYDSTHAYWLVAVIDLLV